MRAILRNVVFLFVEPKFLVDFILGTLSKDDYQHLRIDLYAEYHKKLIAKSMNNHIYSTKKENLSYINRWARFCVFHRSVIVYLIFRDKKNILRILGLLNYQNIPERIFKDRIFVWACDIGEINVVKHILQLPGEEELSSKGILRACCSNHVEIVKLLLQDARIDPAGRDRTQYVLKQSIFYGHVEVVKLLLSHPHVYPSSCHNEALHLAIQYNRQQCVAMLKSHPKFISDEEIEKLKKKIKR